MCRPNHVLWYLLSRKSNCSSASVQSRFPFLTFHALKSVHVQVRIFDNQALHPHTLTPSHAHNLTPSHLIPSHPHTIAPFTPICPGNPGRPTGPGRPCERREVREKEERKEGERGEEVQGGTMVGALFDWTTLHTLHLMLCLLLFQACHSFLHPLSPHHGLSVPSHPVEG